MKNTKDWFIRGCTELGDLLKDKIGKETHYLLSYTRYPYYNTSDTLNKNDWYVLGKENLIDRKEITFQQFKEMYDAIRNPNKPKEGDMVFVKDKHLKNILTKPEEYVMSVNVRGEEKHITISDGCLDIWDEVKLVETPKEQQPITLTKQQIAERLNIPVDKLTITV